ncbi:AAA family ATPase [candidate division KSB1 bacterium]|nr:AAA family ATPase [candidate division KSB1 bacterium]
MHKGKEMKKSHCQALEKIKGSSQQIIRIKAQIQKIAAHARLPVLITGETGTGKELVANALHACSDRHANPLVKINCSAIPENLIESQLFGHCKGAFTGATEAQTGLVEEAHTGTLFLDEIGELPMPMQAKLLRFLEDFKYRRLGEARERHTNVWIIAATNKDINEMNSEHGFRSDLFYRLNAMHLYIPPLRERIADIEILIRHFEQHINSEVNGKSVCKRQDLLHRLKCYSWPGNIRQLKNVIERLTIMEDPAELLNLIENELLSCVDSEESRFSDIERIECIEITKVWYATGGNKSETAKRLCISRNTLKKRLQKYGIEDQVVKV